MKFTIYRATKSFMNTLNHDSDNLNLHRNRSHEGLGQKGFNAMVRTAQIMIDKCFLVPAAVVEAQLNEVFELTNTINRNWVENNEVTVIDESAFLSSSSVGDVFVDDKGQAFIITAFEIAPVDLTNVQWS
ncbi:hypothetical protein [Pseudoalteromonas nigrifaciens]|uniref:hypothetical protein n=1 Tax=Pseudoalteromonas nigrifaciens TaxID=28109 RepID=UPI003FD1B0FB